MERITVNAPAKINWYLNVLNKRSDGYHNIETVMQTIDIFDTLTFTKTNERSIKIDVENNFQGIDQGENNIIYKAAKALGVYGVDVKLIKNIPVQAGLGGGSSDAAATMLVLNDMFELGYSKPELAKRAANVGADVPFFIYGGACVAKGIGEILEPIKPVLRYDFRIEKPEAGLSTAKIYNLLDTRVKQRCVTLEEFLLHFNDNDDKLIDCMFNVMEEVSEELCEDIKKAKEKLLRDGCVAAMMSGSGSAVFGLYDRTGKR